jgi:hypothetical protein
LQLRDLGKEFDEKDRRWAALLEGMPREEALVRVEVIDQKLASLDAEQQKLTQEVARVDELVPEGQAPEMSRMCAFMSCLSTPTELVWSDESCDVSAEAGRTASDDVPDAGGTQCCANDFVLLTTDVRSAP